MSKYDTPDYDQGLVREGIIAGLKEALEMACKHLNPWDPVVNDIRDRIAELEKQ